VAIVSAKQKPRVVLPPKSVNVALAREATQHAEDPASAPPTGPVVGPEAVPEIVRKEEVADGATGGNWMVGLDALRAARQDDAKAVKDSKAEAQFKAEHPHQYAKEHPPPKPPASAPKVEAAAPKVEPAAATAPKVDDAAEAAHISRAAAKLREAAAKGSDDTTAVVSAEAVNEDEDAAVDELGQEKHSMISKWAAAAKKRMAQESSAVAPEQDTAVPADQSATTGEGGAVPSAEVTVAAPEAPAVQKVALHATEVPVTGQAAPRNEVAQEAQQAVSASQTMLDAAQKQVKHMLEEASSVTGKMLAAAKEEARRVTQEASVVASEKDNMDVSKQLEQQESSAGVSHAQRTRDDDVVSELSDKLESQWHSGEAPAEHDKEALQQQEQASTGHPIIMDVTPPELIATSKPQRQGYHKPADQEAAVPPVQGLSPRMGAKAAQMIQAAVDKAMVGDYEVDMLGGDNPPAEPAGGSFMESDAVYSASETGYGRRYTQPAHAASETGYGRRYTQPAHAASETGYGRRYTQPALAEASQPWQYSAGLGASRAPAAWDRYPDQGDAEGMYSSPVAEEDDEEAQLLAAISGGGRHLLASKREASQIRDMVVRQLVDDMTAKVLGHVDRPAPKPQQPAFKGSAQVQKLVASTTKELTAKLLADLHRKPAPPLVETQLPEVALQAAPRPAHREQAPPMVETQLPQEHIWHNVQSNLRLCVRAESPCEAHPCRVELMDVASYGGPNSLGPAYALHQDAAFAHQMAPIDVPRPVEAGGEIPAPALVHSRVELTFEGVVAYTAKPPSVAYTANPPSASTIGQNSFEDGVGVEWATRAALQGEEDRPPPEMIAERMLAILAATDDKCQPGMSAPRSSTVAVAINRPCLYKESDAL